MSTQTYASGATLGAQLESMGFTTAPDGTWMGRDLSVRPAGEWIRLQTDPRRGLRGDADLLGRPGLWRACGHTVFDLPLRIFQTLFGRGVDDVDPLKACIEWALVSSRGELPAGWEAPPAEDVEAPARFALSLVLPCGLAVQGEVVREPNRLALRWPIVPGPWPIDTAARRRHMSTLLEETRRLWRMVRIGMGADGTVVAEVDLSGVPPVVFDETLRCGAAAAKHLVQWLAPHAAMIAESPSRLLDLIEWPDGR